MFTYFDFNLYEFGEDSKFCYYEYYYEFYEYFKFKNILKLKDLHKQEKTNFF